MFFYLELLEADDQEDFCDIYEKNHLKMYHKAYTILKHQEDAENAVHDSFIKLAERYEHYKHLNEEKMTALCITIVKNKAVDILRKKKHQSDREFEDEMIEQSEPDILHEIIELEGENLFRDKLYMLSESLKTVLVLKYYHEFRNGEIAKILDISPRAVEMRLQRAKKILREEWEANGRKI